MILGFQIDLTCNSGNHVLCEPVRRGEVLLRADKFRLRETRNNNIAKHNSEFLPKKGEAMFLVLPRIQPPPMLASKNLARDAQF